MKITDLAVKVCRLEGGKKEVDIAQTKEILRVLAKILGGDDDAQKSWDAYVKRLAK